MTMPGMTLMTNSHIGRVRCGACVAKDAEIARLKIALDSDKATAALKLRISEQNGKLTCLTDALVQIRILGHRRVPPKELRSTVKEMTRIADGGLR